MVCPLPVAGARVVVDSARRLPVTGEFFVLWDGAGPVVKRIELAPGDGLPKLRLHCANPGYASYDRLAADGHIVRKVLWSPRGNLPSACALFFPVV